MSLLYLEETYEYIQEWEYPKPVNGSIFSLKISQINDPEQQLRFEERIGGRFGNHGLLIRVA